ncbi:hypothetical protein F4814DRAFT_457819 [Daldinia grandis]|nr:hypothetical protein F4814DRAFT_457819 [Daldinia grandis]
MQLIDDLGLNLSSGQRDEFLTNIKVVELPKLESPYPPTDLSLDGTPEAKHQWQQYQEDELRRDPQYTKGSYQEIMDLDCSHLKYIVPQEESVIIRDINTRETVLIVLRDSIPDEDLQKKMIGVCRELVKSHQYNKSEYPGMFCHIGYTCGSQKDPQIRLAASCVKLNEHDKINGETELNNKAQGMAGMMWNLMKSQFPPQIVTHYNNTVRGNDFPPIDIMKNDETFTCEVGDEGAMASTGEGELRLFPPSGMTSVYYARHTHTEANGNSWIIACTVNAPDSTTNGSDVYLASYGIMVLPATNTVSAWHPWDYHGTSLHKREPDPEDRPGFEGRKDMVFEILKSLKAARKRSTWLDDRRKWKVTKATSPKASPPKVRPKVSLLKAIPPKVHLPKIHSPDMYSPKVHSPKSGLVETKTGPAPHRYGLRPRITKPQYYIDSESESEFEAEPITQTTTFLPVDDTNHRECIAVKSPAPPEVNPQTA